MSTPLAARRQNLLFAGVAGVFIVFLSASLWQPGTAPAVPGNGAVSLDLSGDTSAPPSPAPRPAVAPPDAVEKRVPMYPSAVSRLNAALAAALGVAQDELIKKMEGHTGWFPAQTAFYVQLVSQNPWIRTVCETGFNGGHSATAFLSAHPPISRYIAFDLPHKDYGPAARATLKELFPGRVEVHDGDSRRTVPEFAAAHPEVRCDVVIVDGGHDEAAASADLKNMRRLAARRNFLLMDDLQGYGDWSKGVQKAWDGAKKEGWVREIECNMEYRVPSGKHGFCIGEIDPQ
ncbi:hypothetical protein DFJ74DRAFT_700485 [Hyaloraphidium curvatum]|nr:hypothetical protein DFJ74DRAFT_700485 [Hyaloraphidium curvatum]